jgi:SpoVK/Ycf46/Vps4 family AAA+-type ATPase
LTLKEGCRKLLRIIGCTDFMNRSKKSSVYLGEYVSIPHDWSKLKLNKSTQAGVNIIRDWLDRNVRPPSEWILGNTFKVGFKILFCGPPGSGKTITAALIGKECHMDVYRIDLSKVISKYIGETEKNLEKIFQKAENINPILLFDEADALFGKRTEVGDAHDRYANQEITYLLQRIEEYKGIAILAINTKNNISSTNLKRFDAIVHFQSLSQNQ